MLKKLISFCLCAIIAIFFSTDMAYSYMGGALPFGVTTASPDNALTRGMTMAGFFGPTDAPGKKAVPQPDQPQPATPQPQGPQAPEAIQPAPAPQPEAVQPAPPPALPAGTTATPSPPQSEAVQPASPSPAPAAPAAEVPAVPQPATVQPAPPPPAPIAPMPQSVRPRTPAAKKGDVSFNFDDADIYSVIQTIFGDVLKVNYIIDPRVKGRVNFRSVAPVAKEDVLPLMEVILRLNGVGIVEEGGLYRIVPIADLPKEPAPVGMGRDSEEIVVTGKARLQVVPIKYIQSTEMTRILTPFMSTSAVIVDVPKSNHIVIIDTDANVKRLLQLVDTFDNEKLKLVTPRVFVYAVQNSKAKDVASLLQQIFQKGGASTAPKTSTAGTTTTSQRPPIPGQPTPPAMPSPQTSVGGQSTGEGLVSEITRIIPDEVTNSIVILATPDDYRLISETISKIDISPRQVLIEGLLVTITLDDNLNYGVAWSVDTTNNITGLKPFKNPINLGGVATSQNGTALTPAASATGFTFVGTDPSGQVRAKLTADLANSKGKVIAAPHIMVSDNREAHIQIGSSIPLATSSTTTPIASGTAVTNTSTQTIQYQDIGIILKVKPQVNDSGLVSMEISQELSSLGTAAVIAGNQYSSIDKTQASTDLVARDGETIIIGGLIREDHNKSKDGIPILGSIPLLGALFSSTQDHTTRTELIILLTPHVVRNQVEAKDVTVEYVDRYKTSAKDKQIDEFIKERGRKEPEKEQPIEPVPNSGK